MNKPKLQEKNDYQRDMERIIENLRGRPSLLLHVCCAPCASAALERVSPFFDVTLFYCNPNTWPEEEYEKRFLEIPKLLRLNGLAGSVNVIKREYDPAPFTAAVRGLEGEPEGGARCPECFNLRLRRTADEAKSQGYDYFATTLTVSPHKNAAVINAIGREISADTGVAWLPSDFKKRDGYLRSIRLSKEYGLYRQCYCGCEYSCSM